jgi:hypothetical protein
MNGICDVGCRTPGKGAHFEDDRRTVMDQAVKTIAVVQGVSSTSAQDLLRDFIARWRPSTRIAGVIEESHGLANRACSAGRLQSLISGVSYPIFQDLGEGSSACHLEGSGAITASEAVRRDIVAGCDLVVLSKFGKLEAAREGLNATFRYAIEAGMPVLSAVSPKFQNAWDRFAAPLYVGLPAEADALDRWWKQVSSSASASGRHASELASSTGRATA